ncbi:MAG TPA: hypothetical protein VG934_00670 [Candidatus Paceibacterota bacterium]|nr:hypothetical protein [Candidatus Paceibacterota bacterium]
MKSDVLAAIMPDRWRDVTIILDAVNDAWKKRGERTLFLRRLRTLSTATLCDILTDLEDEGMIIVNEGHVPSGLHEHDNRYEHAHMRRIEAAAPAARPAKGRRTQMYR